MSSPIYISPEQWYTEKAEYARKGISRGRPIVALEYEHGVALLAENRSASLRKIAEIYDRIAFGGVGKLDEYENLRKAGINYADVRGYSYSRDDVSGRSLANEYSTLLGNVFTQGTKALEVEILISEVHDQGGSFYRVLYDGSLTDHTHFASIGAHSDELMGVLKEEWRGNLSLELAVTLGRKALAENGDGTELDDLNADSLEIAVLDRTRDGRKFMRLSAEEVEKLLGG
jgi:proteasome alpha subunit